MPPSVRSYVAENPASAIVRLRPDTVALCRLQARRMPKNGLSPIEYTTRAIPSSATDSTSRICLSFPPQAPTQAPAHCRCTAGSDSAIEAAFASGGSGTPSTSWSIAATGWESTMRADSTIALRFTRCFKHSDMGLSSTLDGIEGSPEWLETAGRAATPGARCRNRQGRFIAALQLRPSYITIPRTRTGLAAFEKSCAASDTLDRL